MEEDERLARYLQDEYSGSSYSSSDENKQNIENFSKPEDHIEYLLGKPGEFAIETLI
jgi:hypothetical protein